MSADHPRTRRERLLARAIIGSLIVFSLYGLAHTKPVIGLALYLSHRTRFEPHVQRWSFRQHGRPLERELAAGRIRPGVSTDALFAYEQPTQIETVGRYQHLGYFPGGCGGGLVVVAKGGRVVTAISNGFYFFDMYTAEDRDEMLDIQRAELEFRRSGAVARRCAVIGGIGVKEPWQLQADAGP
jgi:hypothetical protein